MGTSERQFATFTFSIVQYGFPSKFCISIVFDCKSQEQLKTMLMQNLGGQKKCIVGKWKGRIQVCREVCRNRTHAQYSSLDRTTISLRLKSTSSKLIAVQRRTQKR